MRRGRPSRFDPTRALQAGFMLLLALCTAQVVWWILDEVHHTTLLHDRLLAEYRLEAQAAAAMLAKGMTAQEINDLYPAVTFSSGAEKVQVDPRALSELDMQRYHRLRRVGWEGGFFIVVLVAGMGVLAQALHQDAQLRRRQQNFLAAVTHEFKSPLASVRLSAETLALRDPPPEKRRQIVARLIDDLERLEAMIENILDTARIEEGRVHLKPERMALAGAVRTVVEELAPRAAAAGVTVDVDIAPEAEIDADPLAVRTVVRNLLDNAIKATAAAKGGTVRVAARDGSGRVTLEVRDDGVGFAPAEASKLFEKFYRPGDEMRRENRGSGLGLYIVRRFVELERGTVCAHSDGPGRGASFTVDWPAAGAAV